MDKRSYIPGIVFLISIFLISFISAVSCDLQYCSSGDSGYDYFVKGTDKYYDYKVSTQVVNGLKKTVTSCAMVEVSDRCVNNKQLWEYNCRSSGLRECEFGCVDGACVRDPSSTPVCDKTCLSTDNGEDIYLKGMDKYYEYNSITNKCELKEKNDYCQDDKTLVEYVGCFSSELIECEFGCVNGACVQKVNDAPLKNTSGFWGFFKRLFSGNFK